MNDVKHLEVVAPMISHGLKQFGVRVVCLARVLVCLCDSDLIGTRGTLPHYLFQILDFNQQRYR